MLEIVRNEIGEPSTSAVHRGAPAPQEPWQFVRCRACPAKLQGAGRK